MTKRQKVPGLLGVLALLSSGCQGGDDAAVLFPAGGPPRAPRPEFGVAVTAAVPPPAISGGTLLLTRNSQWLVASDPDRDAVYVIDRAGRSLKTTIALQPLDEPGRLVEDGAGRVHVVLRRAGALATLDPATGALLSRRAVCPAPRGVAWDGAGDRLHVACAGGELVTVAPDGGAPTRALALAAGLRDVIADGATLHVSRFREADLLTLAGDGTVSRQRTPVQRDQRPFFDMGRELPIGAALAWRASALPGGAVGVLHETADAVVGTDIGSYGDSQHRGCAGIVQTAFTTFGEQGQATTELALAVLAVDFAVQPGQWLGVVAAGNAHMPGVAQVLFYRWNDLDGDGRSACLLPAERFAPTGEAIAIVAAGDDWVVQTREPATLQFRSDRAVVTLSTQSRADTGHVIFHSDSSAGLACASCHGEGGDDARTFQFFRIGPRRTQSLRGGVLGNAPFHWAGDERDLAHLVDDVFVGRMRGPILDDAQLAALSSWLGALPPLPVPAPRDPAAVERGRRLFQDPAVGCDTCHVGGGTNRQIIDVGTRGLFKVPSLRGVWARAPFLHDGCAPSLRDRFGDCGGGEQHGHTTFLNPGAIADLTAYLETL